MKTKKNKKNIFFNRLSKLIRYNKKYNLNDFKKNINKASKATILKKYRTKKIIRKIDNNINISNNNKILPKFKSNNSYKPKKKQINNLLNYYYTNKEKSRLRKLFYSTEKYQKYKDTLKKKYDAEKQRIQSKLKTPIIQTDTQPKQNKFYIITTGIYNNIYKFIEVILYEIIKKIINSTNYNYIEVINYDPIDLDNNDNAHWFDFNKSEKDDIISKTESNIKNLYNIIKSKLAIEININIINKIDYFDIEDLNNLTNNKINKTNNIFLDFAGVLDYKISKKDNSNIIETVYLKRNDENTSNLSKIHEIKTPFNRIKYDFPEIDISTDNLLKSFDEKQKILLSKTKKFNLSDGFINYLSNSFKIINQSNSGSNSNTYKINFIYDSKLFHYIFYNIKIKVQNIKYNVDTNNYNYYDSDSEILINNDKNNYYFNNISDIFYYLMEESNHIGAGSNRKIINSLNIIFEKFYNHSFVYKLFNIEKNGNNYKINYDDDTNNFKYIKPTNSSNKILYEDLINYHKQFGEKIFNCFTKEIKINTFKSHLNIINNIFLYFDDIDSQLNISNELESFNQSNNNDTTVKKVKIHSYIINLFYSVFISLYTV